MTCPSLFRLAALAALVLGPGACRNSPSQPDEETGGSTSTTGGASSGATEPCSVGMNGCPCTGGGVCDPGLVCTAQLVCEPGSVGSDATTGSTTEIVGDDTSTSETTALTTGTTSEGSSTSTTGGAECNTPGSPEESVECMAIDVGRPFCGAEGTCVACADDMACEVATPDRPFCQKTGDMAGACVECNSVDALGTGQCSAAAPHCNLDTMVCEGCAEHSECPDTACDIAARTCFPDNRMVYVRRGPTMANPCTYDVPTGGYPDLPYCDMASAIDHAQNNGTTSGWTFVLMPSDSSDPHGAFDVPGGNNPISYAVIHQLGSPLDKHTRFTALGPVITVHNKVTLYVVNFGVYIKDNAFADSHLGVDCLAGGSVWLDDSRILYSRGPGVRADNCAVHLRRSSIAFGKTEGVDITGGSLHLLNSFIDENGSNKNLGGGAIHMSDGAVADIVYSTLANNVNEPLLGGDTIDCDGPATVKIRNSIFARGADTGNASVVCDEGDVLVLDSVVDGDFGADNGNHKLAAKDILLALDADSITGAYRISGPLAAEKFEDKAVWQDGDPHDDYDRQPRNVGMGASDYAGADFYVP